MAPRTKAIASAIEAYGEDKVLSMLVSVKRYGIENMWSSSNYFNDSTSMDIMRMLYPDAVAVINASTPNGDFYEHYKHVPIKH